MEDRFGRDIAEIKQLLIQKIQAEAAAQSAPLVSSMISGKFLTFWRTAWFDLMCTYVSLVSFVASVMSESQIQVCLERNPSDTYSVYAELIAGEFRDLS